MDETFSQGLCEKLVENDPDFLKATIQTDWSDEYMDRVANAMRENTSIKKVEIEDTELSLREELALFSAILSHPKVKKLSFWEVEIEDLGNVVRMFRKGDNSLIHLYLDSCTLNSGCLDSISCLIREGLLEYFHIKDCGIEDDSAAAHREVARLAEALGRNTTLKELTMKVGYVVSGERISFFEVTLGFCHLLPGKPSVVQTVKWSAASNLLRITEGGSEIISHIVQASTGHASLQNLTLEIETNLSEESAEAIGSMLRSSRQRYVNSP